MTSKALSQLAAHVNKHGGGAAVDYNSKKSGSPSGSELLPPPVGKHLLSMQICFPGSSNGVTVIGGWLQLNYTVLPYVVRHKLCKQSKAGGQVVLQQRWLPLSVLRNAANLLTNVEIGSMRATAEESTFLNQCCHQAGVTFKFVTHTKLVTLEAVLALHKGSNIFVQELSAQDLGMLQETCHPGTTDNVMTHQGRSTAAQAAAAAAVEAAATTMSPTKPPPPYRPPRQPPPAYPGSAEIKMTLHQSEDSISSSSPAVQHTSHHSLHSSITIQPAKLCGKVISCLLREDGKRYALLDALCRVFFPHCSVKSVQMAVERDAKLPTKMLTVVEEKAFITFYQLPLKVLRCRVLVDIELVAPHLNALRMVLQGDMPYHGDARNNNNNNTSKRKQMHSTIGLASTKKTDWLSVPDTSVAGVPHTKQALDSGQDQTRDTRLQNTAKPGALKTKRRRLEDTINKLKHLSP